MVSESDRKRYESLFEGIDLNKDGAIGVEELKKVLRQYLPERSIQKHAEDFTTKSDTNLDKKLSLEEFVHILKENEKQLKIKFDAFDKNDDGKIDASEIRDTFKGLDMIISHAEAEHLSRKIDKDGNLSLDWAEWRNFFQFATNTSYENMIVFWRQSLMIDIGESLAVPPEFTQKERQTDQWWKLLISGGVAGAVSRTTTAPMDRVKTFYQVHGDKIGRTGVVGVVRRMLVEGGLGALWRGNGVNILKITPETAIKFYAYESLKRLKGREAGQQLTVLERLFAGSAAGLIAQSTIYPLEVIKTRMLLAKSGQYSGMLDCFSKILRAEGVRGMYRGYVPNMLGIIPYAGIDLTIFESLKLFHQRYHHNNNNDNNYTEAPGVLVLLTCGTLSSTLAQLCTYPLTLVRTRMQAKEGDQVLAIVKKIVGEHGLRGLYRGIVPNVMKVLPAVTVSCAVYEKTKSLLLDVL